MIPCGTAILIKFLDRHKGTKIRCDLIQWTGRRIGSLRVGITPLHHQWGMVAVMQRKLHPRGVIRHDSVVREIMMRWYPPSDGRRTAETPHHEKVWTRVRTDVDYHAGKAWGRLTDSSGLGANARNSRVQSPSTLNMHLWNLTNSWPSRYVNRYTREGKPRVSIRISECAGGDQLSRGDSSHGVAQMIRVGDAVWKHNKSAKVDGLAWKYLACTPQVPSCNGRLNWYTPSTKAA